MDRPTDIRHRPARWRPGAVSRFVRDRRANTMMLTAAVMMPMLGIVGAAVDMSRGYMAKTRLQQACDAGVLAGRRAMSNSLFTTEAQTQAREMFRFNFPLGQYSSTAVTFTPTRINASDISGVATARIPMAVMQVMGMKPFDLKVECNARQEISNTDIMLVLDVTGSMNQTNSGDSTNRITALRSTAMSFFDTLMAAATDDGIIRFGMVPYNETVNARELVFQRDPAFIADAVTLPSRKYGGVSDGKHYYDYNNFTLSSAQLKAGGQVQTRTGDGNALQTHTALPCLMEPDTASFPIGASPPSNAYDMDIDHVPGGTNASKFRVMVPSYFYPKNSGLGAAYQPGLDWDRPDLNGVSGYDPYDCVSSPARKLTRMRASDRSTFKSWIDGLSPVGGTIHTAGMAWGGRLLSPDGMFSSENKTAPNGRPIARHLIFMTDGQMDAKMWRYGYQGREDHMGRLGGTSESNLEARNRDRFVKLCAQAKAKDITIWVVNFGDDATAETEACASTGKFMAASNNTQLNEQFQSIARQISRLRLSK